MKLVASVLAAGAAALTAAALWIDGIRTYACDEGIAGPSGWIYVGFVLFAVGIVAAGLVGAVLAEVRGWVQQASVIVALAEGVAALLLAVWLNGKYSHFNCG